MNKNSNINCIGFIMDGNRRWAKEQNLPTFEGHQKGGSVLAESVKWIKGAGIPHAVYYGFSTENWNRSPEEVSYLMGLFSEWLSRIESDVDSQNKDVRIRIIGRKTDFSPELQKQMAELEDKTAKYDYQTTIWLALSYGGRAEIVEAVNQVVKQGQSVTEESFRQFLWAADMPDADIIVRPGGEKRLSNFMTWHSVYSELIFIDKYWPALTETDFKEILKEYERRERRQGR